MGDHKKAELALGKYLSFDGLSLSNISDYYFAATPGASLSGGGGDEVFFANSDATNAASLASTMNGGGGDDTFVAGAARETFNGSTGSDFVVYKDSPTGVSVDLLNGVGYLGWAAGDHYNSVEGAVGSPFQDVLVGNNGANILDGGAGSDLIDGGGGADILIGGAGEDRIYGFFSGEGDGGALPHTGFSQIFGGAGNDTIFASAEAEHIDGGTGLLDHVSYEASNAAVSINLHTHSMNGGSAQGDTLTNVEWITGSAFNDVLVGDPLNYSAQRDSTDPLTGHAATDVRLEGGAGDDTLTGGAGARNSFFYDLTQPATVLAVGSSHPIDIGHDIITDFKSGTHPGVLDADRIDFVGAPLSAEHFAQSGANTIVTFDNVLGDITVLNTLASTFFSI